MKSLAEDGFRTYGQVKNLTFIHCTAKNMRGGFELRTRESGPYVHIQMHADLDPSLSLETAHEVMVEAENRILAAFPAADIIIHPDPRGRAEPHGGAFAETGHEAAR